MAFSPLQTIGNLFTRAVAPGRRLDAIEQEKELLEQRRNDQPAGKVKAAWGNNSVLSSIWWLPYHDSITGETAGMRAAYRSMLRNPAVKAALLGKVMAGASLDWQIQPKNPDSPRDLECCDFLRHCINRLPGGMVQLFQTLTLPRLIDGYSLSEPTLTIERDERDWLGKIVMSDVKTKHPDYYQIVTDEYATPFAVEGRLSNSGNVWDIKDFVYSRYLPLYDDPRGTSDLRAAYNAYFMRDTVGKLRAVNAEKYIAPFFVGTWTNQDDKGTLEKALERTKSNTWVAIPDKVKMEAISIANRGEPDFKAFIDDCDKQILVGICGAYLQILEGQVADGRGSSSVSKSISELFQWLLLSLVQEDINKQLFPRLVAYNYLGVGVPSLVMGGINEEEIGKILANIILAQQAGIEVSKKDTYRRIAFSMPNGPDDILKPMSPAMIAPTSNPLPFVEAA
jgi:hypothetical protein